MYEKLWVTHSTCPLLYKKRSSTRVTKVLHSFLSSITEQRWIKLKMYQDEYFCFGLIYNHVRFLKDLTWRFLATLLSTIFLFNVLAHRYKLHRKNDLIEAKQIAHLNRSISLTVMFPLERDPPIPSLWKFSDLMKNRECAIFQVLK